MERSDYQKTGKLYPRLDSYMVLQRDEYKGAEVYMGSSCQFKTQRGYKAWLLARSEFSKFNIKIMKGA
jgi:hypothetical protein